MTTNLCEFHNTYVRVKKQLQGDLSFIRLYSDQIRWSSKNTGFLIHLNTACHLCDAGLEPAQLIRYSWLLYTTEASHVKGPSSSDRAIYLYSIVSWCETRYRNSFWILIYCDKAQVLSFPGLKGIWGMMAEVKTPNKQCISAWLN